MSSIPIISAKKISKSFSGRKVLDDFDIEIMPGEIHSLVGQNGSGKSTFIKILSGYHAPDSGGSLYFNGKIVNLPLGPTDPSKLGMSFVHQDLGLVDSATILENLRIGSFHTHLGWYISWKEECLLAQQALSRFGLDLDPNTKLASLSHVDKAMIAIIRALENIKHAEHGVLVLDEPTSYLPRDDAFRLFSAVHEVASMGHGVIFISHRIEEVLDLSDSITVLRDGRKVGTFVSKNLDEEELLQHILGFSLNKLYPDAHLTKGIPILLVSNLNHKRIIEFNLEANSGEIIGLTGLSGMGQDDVLYLLYGAYKAKSGSVKVGQKDFDLQNFSPINAMQEGLALLPANRLRDGASQSASLVENMTLATLEKYFRRGVLNLKKEHMKAVELIQQFKIRPEEPDKPFNTFSGGNQQKALLAKWMALGPKVLMLHEPSQGVDVGARKQIFSLIRSAADQGMTILIASTEYDDLAALCNRVLVFRDGRVVSELAGASLSSERILEQCYRKDSTTKHDPKAETNEN